MKLLFPSSPPPSGRFWLAVAFIAAMLAFAPQAALAHETRHCAAEAGFAPKADRAAVAPAAIRIAAQARIAPDGGIAPEAMEAPGRAVSASGPAGCGDSCCLGAGCCFGPGCGPLAIAHAGQDLPPPLRDGLTAPPPRLGRPSAARASLLEPPNAAA